MTDRRDKRGQSKSEKRPYHRPRLVIYGDVNTLTRAKDFMSAKLDGATGMIAWFTVPLRS